MENLFTKIASGPEREFELITPAYLDENRSRLGETEYLKWLWKKYAYLTATALFWLEKKQPLPPAAARAIDLLAGELRQRGGKAETAAEIESYATVRGGGGGKMTLGIIAFFIWAMILFSFWARLSASGMLPDYLREEALIDYIAPEKGAELHFQRAYALQQEGHPAEAAVEYRQTIRLDPAVANAYNNLGNVLVEQGDLAGAEAAYTEGIARFSDRSNLHYGRGLVYFQRGDYTRYEEEMEEVIALNPGYTDAYLCLFDLYAAEDRDPDLAALLKRYAAASGKSGEEIKRQIRDKEGVANKAHVIGLVDRALKQGG